MTRSLRTPFLLFGLVAVALGAPLALARPAAAQEMAADGPVTEAAAQAESATGADPAPGSDMPESMLVILNAADVTLEEFRWTNRLVVVFADTPADPRFNEQIELLTARPAPLIERDVIVITDTDPDARTSVRRKLRPRGFQMALIGKDGEVELRKPSPWSVREISRSIDKMPLRQQEIREGKAGAG
jgi:hypothetical protein